MKRTLVSWVTISESLFNYFYKVGKGTQYFADNTPYKDLLI